MRRRTLLVGAAATLVAAGCSNTEGAPSSRAAPVTVPTGTAPLVIWALEGGAGAPGLLTLRPPHLVVYPHGPVIADAAYRSDLMTDELNTLITVLSETLRGPNAAEQRDGISPEPNAPTTVLTVRSTKGTYSAKAAALEELRAKEAYPDALYGARDRIAEVYHKVISSGQPYSAERVRLVMANQGPAASEAQRWPATVPRPAQFDEDGVCVVTATADEAREIVRALTRDLDLNSAWPTYRLDDGSTILATWRYLLPHE